MLCFVSRLINAVELETVSISCERNKALQNRNLNDRYVNKELVYDIS